MSAPTVIPDRFACARYNLRATLLHLENPNFTEDPECLAVLLDALQRETAEFIGAYQERATKIRSQFKTV